MTDEPTLNEVSIVFNVVNYTEAAFYILSISNIF